MDVPIIRVHLDFDYIEGVWDYNEINRQFLFYGIVGINFTRPDMELPYYPLTLPAMISFVMPPGVYMDPPPLPPSPISVSGSISPPSANGHL